MHLPTFITELFRFGLKQANAAIFGGLLLGVIIAFQWVDFESLPITRYDAIFISAIMIQGILVATKMEHLREVAVICAFHLVGTLMELFKTHPAIGSWRYPGEPGFFMLATVPMFSGFLYASVGSYIARVWRIFRFHFTHYPRLRYTVLLAVAIYANFFTHHFLPDIRWLLFVWTFLLFRKTWIHFTIIKTPRSMPLLVGFGLVAFFLYVAENIGTLTHTWLYPNQEATWELVSLSKYGAWYLLMIISFVLVTVLYRRQLWQKKLP